MKTLNFALSGTLFLAGSLAANLGFAPQAQAAPKKVLVVTVTKGFRHSSIATAEKVLAQLGSESGAFSVDYARVEPTDPQFKGSDGKPDGAKVDAAITRLVDVVDKAFAVGDHHGPVGFGAPPTIPRAQSRND